VTLSFFAVLDAGRRLVMESMLRNDVQGSGKVGCVSFVVVFLVPGVRACVVWGWDVGVALALELD
jgi:hypothetical protein